MTLALCILINACVALLSPLQIDGRSPNQDAAGARAFRPALTMTGRESEFAEPAYHRVGSQTEFDALWIEHMGPRVTRAAQGWAMTPQVDFDAYDAVFIFQGDGVNANGIRVVETTRAEHTIGVRFERISFQTSSMDGRGSGVPARAWALLVVPRTNKTIVLEENVQGIIGRPPIWKQRSKLDRSAGR